MSKCVMDINFFLLIKLWQISVLSGKNHFVPPSCPFGHPSPNGGRKRRQHHYFPCPQWGKGIKGKGAFGNSF